jgi:hypothetical protein
MILTITNKRTTNSLHKRLKTLQKDLAGIFPIPLYLSTPIHRGDGKTCGEGVACAFPIPLYVSTRLQSGGEKSPIPTQNRFNGFRVKRLKPFGNGVVVCALSNPWMNPGANLNVNSMTEQIYVSTRLQSGDGKTPTSTQNPLYVSTRLQSGGEKSPIPTPKPFQRFIIHNK